MRIRLALVSTTVLLAFGALPKGASADDAAKIGFELYSWKTDATWNFSVLEGTATVRTLASIQASKTRLRGATFLKGRLVTLPPGETLYWREDKDRGLRLPPKELIHDIVQFAETSQLSIILPNEIPAP
jgi:hypothetical protein